MQQAIHRKEGRSRSPAQALLRMCARAARAVRSTHRQTTGATGTAARQPALPVVRRVPRFNKRGVSVLQPGTQTVLRGQGGSGAGAAKDPPPQRPNPVTPSYPLPSGNPLPPPVVNDDGTITKDVDAR